MLHDVTDVTSGHEDGAEGLSVASTVSEDNDEEEMKALETLLEIQIDTFVHQQLSELVTMSENKRLL